MIKKPRKKRIVHNPSVLVPYKGPDPTGETNDIFIYLRPETNGVEVESALLKVIKGNSRYKENVKLVYMANYPGDYINSRHIIEHHYANKIKFAENGKKYFTKNMIVKFENHYKCSFKKVKIINPYDAMKIFRLDEEELFKIWVEPDDFMTIYGNSIKKYKGYYIINYDIPAILHKNNYLTDIAVMLFRVYFPWKEITAMISDMEMTLRENNIIAENKPAARIFHCTKSPFEQVQDGIEYLYNAGNKNTAAISFLAYAEKNGISIKIILNYIKNPIVTALFPEGLREDTIYEFTKGMTYSQAAAFLKTVR
ncbi:MAG: hypothetical protein RBT69_07840 [Spirochaetia bacterium]|nr:hypothetical protein [Spirochaetia bacterium]